MNLKFRLRKLNSVTMLQLISVIMFEKDYIAYNEQGKKSIPKFIKQYNLEVEETNLISEISEIYWKRLWPFCETITRKGKLRRPF